MSKRKFDEVLAENAITSNAKSLTVQALENFKTFLDTPVPFGTEIYEWKSDEVLIDIFSFESANEFDLAVSVGQGGTIYYPLARVLASGGTEYQVGDVVKLRDADVTTVENPAYRDWVQNELSASSMKQKGEEPPRYGSNVIKTFGPHLFSLNPLLREENSKELYFKVRKSQIENKILDVDSLFAVESVPNTQS